MLLSLIAALHGNGHHHERSKNINRPGRIPFYRLSGFSHTDQCHSRLPLVTLILLALTTFILMFFRDPERFTPEDSNAIVSPADGRIIVAELVHDKRFHDEEVFKISIFMNVFNVHVNRVPASGTINRVRHVPGAFLAADNQKAHLKNEFCAVSMTTEHGRKITVVQIAGLIARRIVCRVEPGDSVARAERFGIIRFGSRLDLYLPADASAGGQAWSDSTGRRKHPGASARLRPPLDPLHPIAIV